MDFHVEIENREYTHLAHRLQDSYNKLKQGRVSIPRDEIAGRSFRLGETDVYIHADGEPYFGGVLSRRKRAGASTTLTLNSFEDYAQDAEPVPDGLIISGSDSDIFRELLADVPELEPGQVDTTTGGLRLRTSRASPARMLRKLRDITGAYIRYNPDKTVDYLAEIGESRDVTLSPQKQNFGEMDIEEMAGHTSESTGNITHLRMLGAGSGGNQLQVDVNVNDIDDIDRTYDPEEDRARWATFTDQSIDEPETIESKARTILRESYNPAVRVTGQAYDVLVNIGDEFRIINGRENFSENLRVSSYTETVDDSGLVTEVKASNNNTTDIDGVQETRGTVEELQKEQVSREGDVSITENLENAPSRLGNLIYLQSDDDSERGVYHFDHVEEAYQRGMNAALDELQRRRLKDLQEYDLDFADDEEDPERPTQLIDGEDVLYDTFDGFNTDLIGSPLGSISNYPLVRGEDVEDLGFDFGFIEADPTKQTPYRVTVSADFRPRIVELTALLHPESVGSTYISPTDDGGIENATGWCQGIVDYGESGAAPEQQAVIWYAGNSASQVAHRTNMTEGTAVRLAYLSNNGETFEGWTTAEAGDLVSGGFRLEFLNVMEQNPIMWKAYR